MHLLIVVLFVFVHVNAQETSSIEPEVLYSVFGLPPESDRTGGLGERTEPLRVASTAPTPASTTELCDIQRNTTEKNEFLNNDGQTCKCVPYYLCDSNQRGTNINNASVTGYGQLDIRFGEDECQESVEICCTEPKDAKDVVIPKPPKPKGCGYRNPDGLDIKIEGGDGDEAQFGEFPWVVALKDALNNSYSGVGVLIHPEVVLTAAHNVYLYGPNSLIVRAGEWDTQTEKEIYPYQERGVEEIVLNEDFLRRNVFNDIAILRLKEPFELAAHINVICLPNQGESFDQSKKCAVGGWGKDKFGLRGRYAVFLKKIEQDMVPHERCEQLLKNTRLGPRFRLHSSFVCAGGELGKDACQGDGGAPLVCPIGDNRYKLAGLVSWGIGCGKKDVPGVYAAVPNYREWVDNKMAAWGFDTSGYKV